jgi:HD-like signal output (HDOD) protein
MKTTELMLADALRATLDSLDVAIPMLPGFAHRVIDMVSDEDVSVAQLAAVVSKDQVLASRLLGLANSAYFAAMSEISTVQNGLLHDIGTLVILKAAYDARRQVGTAVPQDVLDEIMREMHPHVGAVVLGRCRLNCSAMRSVRN